MYKTKTFNFLVLKLIHQLIYSFSGREKSIATAGISGL